MIDQIQKEMRERHMAKVEKKDCLDIDQAAAAVGVSRQTLYNYLNALGIQRYRFPFDRKTYVLRTDVERMQEIRPDREDDDERE